MTGDTTPAPEISTVLARTEEALDPGDPERGGAVHVLGHGEISVALAVSDLPGLVCKRMSGFSDDGSAAGYATLVEDYLEWLGSAGARVAPTDVHTVHRGERPPVVYLVQPRMAAETLGDHLLRTADDQTVGAAVAAALAVVGTVARHSGASPDDAELALDGQLSNWSFDPDPESTAPLLIDVGTPFVRRRGVHAMDREVLLAPVPPGIRAYYRRRRLVEAYLDDYFVPRTVAVDLLGNFHKEGAAARLPTGLEAANAWLDSEDLPGPTDPVTLDEVERYYRQDADLLALYLRLRRMDRFLRTRVLRRTYDYVLPDDVTR
jgi:hypothetical protein